MTPTHIIKLWLVSLTRLTWRWVALALWGMTAYVLYSLTLDGYMPYYYISFEDAPGVNVLIRAHIGETRTQTARPVPLQYEIVRPTYRLHIESVDGLRRELDPVTFEATSLDGEPLNIQELKTEAGCGRLFRAGAPKNAGAQSSEDADKKTVMALNIDNFLHVDPTAGICAKEEHAFVLFQVTDGDCNILGVEKLPYTISRNGSYLEHSLRLWL